VTISNEMGYVKTTTELTDKRGEVLFPVLRPGAGYVIQVSFPGFSPLRLDNQRVRLSQTTSLPVQMMEQITEQVKVVATGDVVDLDKSEQSTRFSDDFISDLPVPGRFYQNVLTMAPGVQDADGDGNPNVHGSRSRDFQAVVGNVSNVDPLTGQWMSRINTNSIEEMEVITAGAGVEFGRAQGGFARIIQKQGSNTHEGIVEMFYRTSKLDGDGARDGSALDTPDFESTQPSFQFSGPLKKDKLWYRVSYEQINDETPVNVLSGIEIFERQRETQDVQLTWQVSPRNKVAFQFRADPDEATNANISSRVAPESSLGFSRDVETYTVNWTAPYSPKVLVESTFAWQDISNSTFPSMPGLRNNCVPNANQQFLNEAYCTDLTANVVSGSWWRTEQDNRQRFTVKGQATVYGGRFWGMTHQFRMGVNVENERYFRQLEERPQISFQVIGFGNDDSTIPEGETPNIEQFGQVVSRISVPSADEVRATGTNWAVYGEDQFKPAQNLTITLGARVDREELNSGGRAPFDAPAELQAYSDFVKADPGNPTLTGQWPRFFTGYEDIPAFTGQLVNTVCAGAENFDSCAIDASSSIVDQQESSLLNVRKAENINISNTNVSPFISLAWSPWANGKTAFKASAGRYYNNLPLLIPLQELEPAQVTIQYRASLQDADSCPTLPPDTPPGAVECGKVQLDGSISPRFTVLTVDRNLRTPYQDEFTFKFERELWAETSFSTTYINRKFQDQIQDLNINVENGDLGRCVRETPSSIGRVMEESPGVSSAMCSVSTTPSGNPRPCAVPRSADGSVVTGRGDCPLPNEVCDYSLYLTNPEEYCRDWTGTCLNNEFTFGTACAPGDPFCGLDYPDTVVGDGDGFVDPVVLQRFGAEAARFDNCIGDFEAASTGEEPCGEDDPFCTDAFLLREPDEAPDLYQQNVFWDDIFLIGNFNEIDYQAVVFEIIRRQYRSWEMNASYTWSEATGNGEDFFQELGDDPTLRENQFGFQSYDQRHVVKFNATTITPWGIRFGTSVTWQSGLPYSLVRQSNSFDTAPPVTSGFAIINSRPRQTYVNTDGTAANAERNSERNISYWNVDLKATKELRLGKNMNLQLSIEVFNALNDGTYQVYNPSPFVARGIQVNGRNEAIRRFGRRWQLGAKLAF
jgi:hypothetical protein